MGEPLEILLEQLAAGDPQAADQLLLTYEPYLRGVVRRQLPRRLRAKFDSSDVVQSVWAHVLHGFRAGRWHFPNARALRAFLVKVTLNCLNDRGRHHRRALDHEQAVDTADLDGFPATGQARASDIVGADDLWEKLLALCPPAHRELLHLKRQGLPLAEIAARTGLHEGSVRRIIRGLARQLALEQSPLSPPAGV